MSDEPKQPDSPAQPEGAAEDAPAETPGPIHPLQRLLDNPWLLLVLGFVIPFLSYTVWGWIELLMTKPAQLP